MLGQVQLREVWECADGDGRRKLLDRITNAVRTVRKGRGFKPETLKRKQVLPRQQERGDKQRRQPGSQLGDAGPREAVQVAIHAEGAEHDIAQRQQADDDVAELAEDILGHGCFLRTRIPD